MQDIWYIGYDIVKTAPEFIMLVKTDNTGTSGSNEFTIPTSGSGYNYNIETIEHNLTNQTGNVTLTFSSAGEYQIKISGNFPQIRFNNGGDRLKLLEVQNWGNIVWSNFSSSFQGCANMDLTATDTPNIGVNASLGDAFRGCSSLVNANGSMANWNTANVNSMINCFRDATSFNQNIGSWNTANVANMSNCFRNATAFNQDISSWNTANVSSFEIAFRDAKAFNQNLGSWNLRAAGVNCQQFFRDIDDMSTANYTDTLVGMINNAVDNGNLPINVNFTRQDGNTFDRARSGGSNFANAGLARDFAINTLNWDITSDTVIN